MSRREAPRTTSAKTGRSGKHPAAAPAAPAQQWPARLRSLALGGSMALVVASVLVPSEGAILEGSYAPLAAGWCVLAVVYGLALWLDPAPRMRLGWTEIAIGGFVAWYAIASLVALGDGNGRQALNALWLVVGYALTVFLLRQTLASAGQVRAVVAAMLWLATLLAALGFYQYFISVPALRRAYAASPLDVLAANGIPTDPNQPSREQFENRLNSVEPLATFALTNSLAGFLAPWLVAVLAIALACVTQRPVPRAIWAALALALVMAGCLVLTKSRTGVLALLVGLALIAVYGRSGGWRIDWRLPALATGVLGLLALAAVAVGGLDVEVLSEAPKSVLYRLEYWQATAALIGDHPLFGSGPGNFQETYPAYKLPQASENIADPHNLFLEVWANAGTPALLALLLIVVGFVVDLNRAARAVRVTAGDAADGASAMRPIAWGALAGLFLALPFGALSGHSLLGIHERLPWLPAVWVIGVPLGTFVAYGLGRWIREGQLSLAALVVPMIVLLVNLLAAGAFTFPGVMSTLLALLPAALAWHEITARTDPASPSQAPPALPRSFAPSRLACGGVLLLSLGLAYACVAFEYRPVLASRSLISLAREQISREDGRGAIATAAEAARADPLLPEPWRLLADLHLHSWVASGDPRERELFDATVRELLARNPRHHIDYRNAGDWYLLAWRKSGQKEDMERALASYRAAIERYPTASIYHAQWAWALSLADRRAEAAAAAKRALELDQLNPHLDRKLNRRHLFDPHLLPGGIAANRVENAEQTAKMLRTAGGEGKAP